MNNDLPECEYCFFEQRINIKILLSPFAFCKLILQCYGFVNQRLS